MNLLKYYIICHKGLIIYLGYFSLMKYRKESKTITRIFFVVFFSLILLLQFSDNWVSGINVDSNQKIDFDLTSTIGIQITEANIASYSSSGTGAPGDPYIIEDMMIDTTDSLALEFYYVTSYFILRDSSLKGTTYGVILNGVASGVSQVINCIIEGAFSIGGLNSHYMTIHNCTLRSTQGSSFTRGLNFTKNVVEIAGPSSGSIMTVRDEDNIITGNTIYGEASAVKLSHITNSLIVNNGLYGAGFYMYEDSIVNILSNTFSENNGVINVLIQEKPPLIS